MNKKIYIWTIFISLFLLIPACIWDYSILTILSGIGCSGIAAAIMAIFLDAASLKKESERKVRTRTIYFRGLKEQLKMMLERLLWLEARMSDNFDWDKDPSSYSSFQYMIYASQKYPSNETLSIKEVESKLSSLEKKYTLEQQSNMSPEQLHKVQKMFLILYSSSIPLMTEVNSLNSHKVELDAEDYLPLCDIESICYQVPLAVSLMSKPQKNYGIAISSLLSAYKTVCKAGNYSDEFSIGLHGSISLSEI